MKRFYKQVAVAAGPEGLCIELDGRPVRTPKKALLALAGDALAEAISEEWRQQGEDIVPESMPLLRLANTAIDVVDGQRGAVVDNLASFGGTDLLCYWAGEPEDLAARQEQLWSPWLTWAAERHGAALATTVGVSHISQDKVALAALHRAVDSHDNMELAGLNDLVTISGSLVLALAVSAGALDVAVAWAAAHLDHDYQAEHWGQDAEAMAHAARLRGEFEQAAHFLDLYRAF
ncbi:MAG: ATPase [Alphaproteobacteria bacterium]|nr:ATPase [Alphaproteobacteria bacterium]